MRTFEKLLLASTAICLASCAAAGIVFIGPPAASIRAMGSKSEAKKIMEKARVPLVPELDGAGQPLDRPPRQRSAIVGEHDVCARGGDGAAAQLQADHRNATQIHAGR